MANHRLMLGPTRGDATSWIAMFVTACAAALAACSGEAPGGEAIEESEIVGDAPAAAITIPAGWTPVGLAAPNRGVRVYKKDGKNEYVTIVDMNNATALNLTGPLVAGAANGPDFKLIRRVNFTDFWGAARAQETATRRARVVVSGTFGTFNQPTGLAFGLKAGGNLISYGYAAPGGPSPEPHRVMLFAFNNARSRGWIGDYNRDSFTVSPDVVGAVHVDADFRPGDLTGRTFVGVRDDDRDGNAETILVFSSSSATTWQASTTISAFGAQQKVMLDGSYSTYLIVDGGPRISTAGRLVPHGIAFYSGK
ncbi:hypothetical protein predicted by Glimmer/Critica [Sorangium cellulosum So ce56]|uniref:Uncharacterized protein n=1 Tax=Sorangium cellulosum (strain So ce56) TaxID=448385 RepID=A9GVQ9_SORC5|nr:hypothetical protein [Sorangium cellulosum]CAN93827.1 hypothetical protein predicted by Glimmer/Critica [Sorangium cellulosum So ce56]